jgi:hypothetical protein
MKFRGVVAVTAVLVVVAACALNPQPSPSPTSPYSGVGRICFSTQANPTSCAGESDSPSFSASQTVYLFADIDFYPGNFIFLGGNAAGGPTWGGFWGPVPVGHGWSYRLGAASDQPEVKPGKSTTEQINIWLEDDSAPGLRVLIARGTFTVLP